MRLISNARIIGECPSPSTKVHGKAQVIRRYEIKIQQATPKWIRQVDDKRYRLRVDFYMNTARLELSDLDNLAKTIMDGIFGKFGKKKTKPRDRFVWQLELNKIYVEKEPYTEFWLFDLGSPKIFKAKHLPDLLSRQTT